MIDKDSDAYKAGEKFGGLAIDVIKFFLHKYGLDSLLPVDEDITVEGSLIPVRQHAIEAPKAERSNTQRIGET